MNKREYSLLARFIFGALTFIDFILLIPYNVKWCLEYGWYMMCYPFHLLSYRLHMRRLERKYGTKRRKQRKPTSVDERRNYALSE